MDLVFATKKNSLTESELTNSPLFDLDFLGVEFSSNNPKKPPVKPCNVRKCCDGLSPKQWLVTPGCESCSINDCGKRDGPNSKGNLRGTNLNVILGMYTNLDPIETKVVRDVTSIDEVAICRANGYSVTQFGTPYLTCEEYTKYNCERNDLAVTKPNEPNICVPPKPTSSLTVEGMTLPPADVPTQRTPNPVSLFLQHYCYLRRSNFYYIIVSL